MNRRCVLCFLALTSFVCSIARAELTPLSADPGIDPAAQSDPVATSHVDEISQKVAAELQKLVAHCSDPPDQPTIAMIRQWFIGGIPMGATAAYEEAYTAALNKAFIAALKDPNTPVLARLNIGIIVKNLRGNMSNLVPTVIQLLNDKSAVVALWGEAAAGAVLPVALQNNNLKVALRESLLDAMVKAVVSHPGPPLGGQIALDTGRAINAKLSFPANLFPTGDNLKALITANLNLQTQRRELYKTSVPESPVADENASSFLLSYKPSQNVWGQMTPDQQMQAIQLEADLISMVGQRAAAGGNNKDLMSFLHEEPIYLKDLANDVLNDANIAAACTRVQALSIASSPNDISAACSALIQALKANPAFPNLQDPPDLSHPVQNPATSPTPDAPAAQ